MVKDATELGELLKLPDLEEETKALINKKMREFIEGARALTPAEKENQAEDIKAIFNEYLHGTQEGG
ncbi:hypothetical protein [Paenibacillus amylolyticus]|uniref:hypothetical protein n=1 Tax=Paenibacillus amylolyticus TaxID=1451 RepID=UPI000B87A685|nr:hypothetical protein [Paenibacillus amylolyticus]